MRRQERKNAVRLQKMTRHRLRIQQFALTIRSTLHTRIIANNQRTQADRRAGLFRAFLVLVGEPVVIAAGIEADEGQPVLSVQIELALENLSGSFTATSRHNTCDTWPTAR